MADNLNIGELSLNGPGNNGPGGDAGRYIPPHERGLARQDSTRPAGQDPTGAAIQDPTGPVKPAPGLRNSTWK